MRRAACALLAAALTLTACGSEQPAPNYSSVSATPTSAAPTATASATPPFNGNPGQSSPTPLAETTQNTSEGAQAFAVYYVNTIDWVFATGNVNLLDAFYADNCTTCKNRLTFLSGLFSNGSYVSGGRISLISGSIVSNDGRLGAEFAVNTVVSVAAGVSLNSNGSPTSTVSAAPRITLTTWVKRDINQWLIVEERYG